MLAYHRDLRSRQVFLSIPLTETQAPRSGRLSTILNNIDNEFRFFRMEVLVVAVDLVCIQVTYTMLRHGHIRRDLIQLLIIGPIAVSASASVKCTGINIHAYIQDKNIL